jgi:hypothetical protein
MVQIMHGPELGFLWDPNCHFWKKLKIKLVDNENSDSALDARIVCIWRSHAKWKL